MKKIRIANGQGFWGDSLQAPIDLVRRGRWADAVVVNSGAIRAAPITREGYRNLRQAVTGLSGPDAAFAALAAQATIEPNVPWPYYEAAEAARAAGQLRTYSEWNARGDSVNTSRVWVERRRQALRGGGFLFNSPH